MYIGKSDVIHFSEITLSENSRKFHIKKSTMALVSESCTATPKSFNWVKHPTGSDYCAATEVFAHAIGCAKGFLDLWGCWVIFVYFSTGF